MCFLFIFNVLFLFSIFLNGQGERRLRQASLGVERVDLEGRSLIPLLLLLPITISTIIVIIIVPIVVVIRISYQTSGRSRPSSSAPPRCSGPSSWSYHFLIIDIISYCYYCYYCRYYDLLLLLLL